MHDDSLSIFQVFSQVQFGTHKNDGSLRAVVRDLRVPFGTHILKRAWGHNGEANKEHICLRIGQRSKSVVVFLTCSIPQPKFIGFPSTITLVEQLSSTSSI